MKKTIILAGFGQMGKAALPLLNTAHWEFLGFADNDASKWTPEHASGAERVMSMEAAAKSGCDVILLCPISRERANAIKEQLLRLGYPSGIAFLTDFYEALDIRSASLIRMAHRIRDLQLPGAIAELGVYRGELSALLSLLFPDRPLYLFDTFCGFDARDTRTEQSRGFSAAKDGDFSDTSADAVLRRLPHPELCVIRQGFFPDTTVGLEAERFAFVSLDADLYAPTLAGLRFFYPRLDPGGALLLHDYDNARFSGVRQAVADFEAENGALPLVPLSDLHGSCVILKPFG